MDSIFPMVYGRWRIAEVNWFLSHPNFEVDIYVAHFCLDWIEKNIGDNLIQTFENYYQNYPYLKDYHILILDPKYNELNKFNNHFDGKIFNFTYPGSFLFTKAKSIDFASYQVGYCLFLGTRMVNDWVINKNYWPVVTKMYPGGGFENYQHHLSDFRKMAQKGETVIATQEFVCKILEPYFSKVHRIYGVPLLATEVIPPVKIIKNKVGLDVAFACLGTQTKKGFDRYLEVANLFSDKYPQLNIRFHIVGRRDRPCGGPDSDRRYACRLDRPCGGPDNINNKNLICHGVMLPNALDQFYSGVIDIYLSPNRKEHDTDGFPLGGEAMLQGCIPIICDPHGSNKYFGFTENEAIILPEYDVKIVERWILKLLDVNLRKTMSLAIQKTAFEIFKPSRQLNPIANILTEVVKNK